jgi:hypothetical protein
MMQAKLTLITDIILKCLETHYMVVFAESMQPAAVLTTALHGYLARGA